MRILYDPDPPATGGGGPPPASTAPPTAADSAAGGKTAREVALEKRISTLEDTNNTLSLDFKKLLNDSETKGTPPAAATSPAAILDEVNEFLGFGVS